MTTNQRVSTPIESEQTIILSHPISVDEFFSNLVNPEYIAPDKCFDISCDAVNSIRDKITEFLEKEGLRSAQKRAEISDIVARALAEQTRSDHAKAVGKPCFKDRNSYADWPEIHDTNIMQFLEIVWRDELEVGLYRSQLKKADPSAEYAIQNWVRNKDIPPHIKLLSKRTIYSEATVDEIRAARRLVRAAERKTKDPNSPGEDIDLDALRAARRLLSWSNHQKRTAARPGR